MSIKAKSKEIEAKLKEIGAFKTVELLAGQLDIENHREFANRLPALLLMVDDTPLEKLDHEYDSVTFYKALLLHSNKSSRRKQVLEMLDLIEDVKTKLKELRNLILINFAPVENSKELIAYEMNFKYLERI